MQTHVTVELINAILPQTQCTKCGYDGCLPYAQALADQAVDINRCPPGGDAGVAKLAALLGVGVKPIDSACGQPGPLQVAIIDEQHCIGCTLCIQACPVDAIIGANKRMHTVLSDWCTGCDLCLPPCPVDCIRLVDASDDMPWTTERAQVARQRYERRQERLNASDSQNEPAPLTPEADKQAVIAAALARARSRRTVDE